RDLMKNVDPARLIEEFRANVARAFPEMAGQAGFPAKKPVPPAAEIESWEQVEHLLERYVQAHQEDLRADVQKYGDVRAEPGFDPERRRKELAQLRHQEWDRENQQREVEQVRPVMEQLEKELARGPKVKPAKLAEPRRQFLKCYREYSRRPAHELVPAMREWLQQASELQRKHPGFFHPRPVDDEQLLERLAEFGPYEVDPGSKRVKVSWEVPRGLGCDWTTFSLSVVFPQKKNEHLRRLLDAADRLRQRFAQHQADLRREVLQHFEIYREMMERPPLTGDYELDQAGRITDPSILKNAGPGHISLRLPDDSVEGPAEIAVFFHVEWDDEHGLELSLVDELER
ncbi:MAG TPA: hypothetical protein VKD72_30345, partial [Gemmataceae bacterium]|nr:hypothetical protein [Gemmataceae bacterium]